MSIQEFRQHPEQRQQIVRAAQRQRNAALWSLLGRLYAALTEQPKALRKSRWLALHRAW
jgi:hypothetical protein